MISCRGMVVSLSLLTSVSFASPLLTFDGVVTHRLPKNTATPSFKSISISTVKSTSSLMKGLKKKPGLEAASSGTARHLPTSTQLGMNAVPIFDQGNWENSALYAIVAGLDALRGEGDYYSVACSIMLGEFINHHGDEQGQDIFRDLARAKEFGLVTKAQQHQSGCAGVMDDNALDKNTPPSISLEDFHLRSSPLNESGLSFSRTLLDVPQWLLQEKPSNSVLERVKTSLYYGNRVLLATLVPVLNDDLGLVGIYQQKQDAWVMTPRLEQLSKFNELTLPAGYFGLYAMVVTGYDDQAIAVDKEGHPHQGLLTLRHSWGEDVGDQGNFYMSYDYFNVFVVQLTELMQLQA